jgi:hypothetical protein
MANDSNATETNSRCLRSQQYNLRHLLTKKCNNFGSIRFVSTPVSNFMIYQEASDGM